MSGATCGTVTVGLSTAPHVALLPRVLDPFRRRYPDVLLEIKEGLFPAMASNIRQGSMDFYVGAVCENTMRNEINSVGEFTTEKLFENTRLVMARPGHPLMEARSLRDLVGASWVSTSVTGDHEAELSPVFAQYGLPQPKIAVQAHSFLGMITAASSADLLAMFPQQWLGLAHSTKLLSRIHLRERLEAPPILMVARSSLPLTPAAEHLADLLRRAALNRPSSEHMPDLAPVPAR